MSCTDACGLKDDILLFFIGLFVQQFHKKTFVSNLVGFFQIS